MGLHIAGDLLFQPLLLFTLMAYFGQQPQSVPFAARVFGDFQQVAAAQSGLIATALGQLIVGAVAF